MNRLLQYLGQNGILLCSANPELPALKDIGCGWSDVAALIDRHELFCCKAFKKRTTYLSKGTCYLLEKVRQKKPLTPAAQRIYSILEDGTAVPVADRRPLMDTEKNRCLIELRRVKALVEQEVKLADGGKSSRSPFQLRQILKELSAMERAHAKSEFMPYYPRAIADSWDLDDPLGRDLCELATLYDTVMRG